MKIFLLALILNCSLLQAIPIDAQIGLQKWRVEQIRLPDHIDLETHIKSSCSGKCRVFQTSTPFGKIYVTKTKPIKVYTEIVVSKSRFILASPAAPLLKISKINFGEVQNSFVRQHFNDVLGNYLRLSFPKIQIQVLSVSSTVIPRFRDTLSQLNYSSAFNELREDFYENKKRRIYVKNFEDDTIIIIQGKN